MVYCYSHHKRLFKDIASLLIVNCNQTICILSSVEKESAQKSSALKKIQEMEGLVSELHDELDAEQEACRKSEKARKELEEELSALRTELEDTLDTTAAQQELR